MLAFVVLTVGFSLQPGLHKQCQPAPILVRYGRAQQPHMVDLHGLAKTATAASIKTLEKNPSAASVTAAVALLNSLMMLSVMIVIAVSVALTAVAIMAVKGDLAVVADAGPVFQSVAAGGGGAVVMAAIIELTRATQQAPPEESQATGVQLKEAEAKLQVSEEASQATGVKLKEAEAKLQASEEASQATGVQLKDAEAKLQVSEEASQEVKAKLQASEEARHATGVQLKDAEAKLVASEETSTAKLKASEEKLKASKENGVQAAAQAAKKLVLSEGGVRNARPAEWTQRLEDARAERKAEHVKWKNAHPEKLAQTKEDARVSLNAKMAEWAEKRHARAAEEGAHADHATDPEIDRLRQELDRVMRNLRILNEEFASHQAPLKSDFLTPWREDERISNSLDRDALQAACKANLTTALQMAAENDHFGNPELSEELLTWSYVRPEVQAHIRRIRARNRQRDGRVRQDPESAKAKRYVMLKEAAHQVYEARGAAFRALFSCRSKHQRKASTAVLDDALATQAATTHALDEALAQQAAKTQLVKALGRG